MLGGVMFMIGALLMVYNLIMTVRSPRTEPGRLSFAGAMPVAAE
jgi:cbb3-type cytochrome oxidase subunit 1